MNSRSKFIVMLSLIGGLSSQIVGSIAYGTTSSALYGNTCSGKSMARSNGKIINVRAGASIQTAMNNVKPGDTIVLACGTYNQSATLKRSGTNTGWITIKSAKPHCAKINGSVRIMQADYVRVEGLHIINSKIGATACHHIEFVNNLVANGQMILNLSDFLLVDGNEVYGSREGYNLVSILNPQNITGDKTTRNRIVVRNNVLHHNKWPHKTDGNGGHVRSVVEI